MNTARELTLCAVCKCASEQSDYLLTNELIAAKIGTYLGLPVPPYCIVMDDNLPYFASLNFNLSAERLPPVNPMAFVSTFPDIACGIVILDAYICNDDRHARNIAAVMDKASPRCNIFDHDRSLLGPKKGLGIARLNGMGSSIGIDSLHCLARQITEAAGLVAWLQRVEVLPRWVIAEAVNDTEALSETTREERDRLIGFLDDRKSSLRQIIQASSHLFPNMKQGSLL